MANEEHLKILRQGIGVWNRLRREDEDIRPDLGGADLRYVDLSSANLFIANLSEADLRGASLFGALLGGAKLLRVNLLGAHLARAVLRGTDLRDADLGGADLRHVDLRDADLRGAKLRGADLVEANLRGADLDGADLSEAECGSTVFSDINLSVVTGLETVKHHGRSYIDVHTLYNSRGKIPEAFLRGCGIPENLITYLPSLTGEGIEFYSSFISHSHADKDFARRLNDRLQGEGIRCWLDEHQLNPGDPLHPTIYEAIRVYDKVLLCCSETALKSWWVEKEISRAIQKEEDYNLTLIIPLNLDGFIFTSECTGWVADEMKQRLVADFTNWKDHDEFEKAVTTVVNALRPDSGKPPPPQPRIEPRSRST